jgi:streptogramin lyase
VAVDGSGNVFIADTVNNAIKELPRAFVSTKPISEAAGAGADQILPVLPTTQSLTGVFAPTSDQSWLTIGSTDDGVVHFSFTANSGITSRTAHLTVLGQQITITQAPPLEAAFLLEGPAAGADSDIVMTTGAWSATANAPWLHTTSFGSGNGLAAFTFDANPGATRTGTLTIAGETLTVTQAGSNYVAAGVTPLFLSGSVNSQAVAVDGLGNVYFTEIDSDTGDGAVDEWNASTHAVSTLVFSGLSFPEGVAVDASGNVYIADSGNNAIKEWNASTQQVATLVSSGLSFPEGVAVDASGNVYIADSANNAIKEWNPSNQQVTTLVDSGLSFPAGVAVDGLGNVYIADEGNGAIKEWNPSNQQVTTLPFAGLLDPEGVAVDGSGNVYVADTFNGIEEWNASSNQVTTLVASDLHQPRSVAVDGSGNDFIADTGNFTIKELPRAFVQAGPIGETSAFGTDQLLPVLPSTQSLTGAFAPSSDQSWLFIDSVTDGVIHFFFVQNDGPARTANITVLGQAIEVVQAASTVTSIISSTPSRVSVYGQSVTFTASVFSGASPVTEGSVTFTEGTTVLAGDVPVDNSGQASFTIATLAPLPYVYVITATYTGTSQYSPSTAILTQKVDPAPLSITIGNDSQTYGGPAANLSTDLPFAVSTGVNGEILLIRYSSTGDTPLANVGAYAITGTLADGTGQASNYSVTLTPGTLTVAPATLTVSANNAARAEGATNPKFSATITGFVNQDPDSVVSGAASLTTTATPSSGVGDYVITAALGTLSAANYTFAFVNGTLTIYAPVTPAQVSVDATVRNSPVGSAASPVTVVFDAPITPDSFTASALTLSRNGTAVPITTTISVQQGGNANTYLVSGLASYTAVDGSYTLSVDASQLVDDNDHPGAGAASASWLMDATAPTSAVSRLTTTQPGLSFAVSVAGSDPTPANGSTPSGIASYDLYVSSDGKHWSFWTAVSAASPSAMFTGASSTSYGFYSVAHDAAGNVETVSPHVEAGTYVPDYTPPAIHVASVNSATAAFTLNWQGVASGGSGLSRVDLYVQVDGGAVQDFAQVMPGSPVNGVYSGAVGYQALSDGVSHTYRFYSLGTNGYGIQQAAPASADATVTASFAVPPSLLVSTFSVEKGIAERSYVRFLAVGFNDATQLANWYGLGKLRLQQFDLNDANPQNVTLTAGMVSIAGSTMTIDFGAGGVTSLAPLNGSSSTITGDGYYSLALDLDGSGHFATIKNFYRLLGDVNGDGIVNTTDTNVITAALGQTGALLNADVNGDGTVNAIDRTYAARSMNRQLTRGLPMELANGHVPFGQLAPIAVPDVQSLLPAALAAWQRAGLNAAGVKLLEQATVQVVSLPNGFLALTAGSQIRIDATAQGQGWFVDATPAANEEFQLPGALPALAASPGGPAADRIDLLTVLIHEMGHMLGIGETDEVLLPGHVTNEDLSPGVRELPVAADVPAAFLTATQSLGAAGDDVLFVAGTDRARSSPVATAVLDTWIKRPAWQSSLPVADRPNVHASIPASGRMFSQGMRKVVDALFEALADDLD